MATPDFISIIKEKNKRIEDIPSQFLSSVKKTEREIYTKVIAQLGELEIVGGAFVQSVKNIEIAGQINTELKKVLIGSEYTKAVSTFAKEFDVQADLNFSYFEKAFKLPIASEVAVAAMNQAKRNAVDLLLNRAADSEFIAPLQNIIEQSVVNNANYGETLSAIRDFVEGAPEVDSRLLRYSTQIARDSFAISDAAVVSIYADENEFEWFFYSGATIDTTREFCRERAGGFFYYKEIDEWGKGHKTTGLSLPNGEGVWPGMILGTTEATIYSYRGGYNCGHSIMPVSIAGVPLTDIQRNIDQGFFVPTEFERSELGL